MAGLPVVSYAGDRSIFARLESGIVSSLPTAAVEWKRSYGRTSKSVYVEVQFQNFDVDLLLKGRKNLIGQHVLHTFWTDCSDVDVYKNSLKDDILSWLGTLKKTGSSSDWLLVLVENNSSRANKLLARTTVLDRIKQDIGGKTPERCISIMDPTKSDSKAAESMQTFLHKFRQFFLQSYNRTLNRFEELIRSEREKRNEPGWNFCTYFLLQEQLAFAYEIMGLHEEALVQYDELDALFTQFILNSSVGVSPGWLEAFNTQLSDWTGFSLDKNINSRLRTNIEKCSLSLLDLRNYLFSRQGSLLLAMSRGDQVARRCLTFLHNTLQELTIMEVECVQGSKEIWVCLCAFEVLNNTKGNSLHSAALWSFLREKLLVLGSLCGLTPGKTPPTSSQLHLVVSLFGGLMDDKYLKLDNNQQNPAERLKESLSSAPSFQKNYLDIAETAISNYKHIGRIRCARLIGMELAQFYLEADQVHQAIAFLADSLKTFQFEGWEKLSMKTLLDLAKCYKLSQEDEKYLRTCVQIASCPGASSEDRDIYFREILSKLEALSAAGNIIASADDTVKMVSATQVKDSPEDKTVPGCQIKYHLEVLSNLPVTIECERVEVSLVHSVPPETVDGSAASRPAVGQPEVAVRKASMLTMAGGEDRRGGMAAGGQRRTGVNRSPSVASSTASVFSMMDNGDIEEESGDNTGPADAPDRLHMRERLEYKQDKSLYAARLVCKNATKVLKRKDSSGTILKDGQLKPADYTNSLSANNVTLYPGLNKIEVIGEAGIQGVYTLTQMRICWRQLHLLENLTMPGAASFQVASEQPVILLNKGEGELFAGRPNKLSLSIYCGSESLPEGQQIQVTCGRGLVARTAGANHEYNPTVVVTFPGGQPFETVSQDIWVLCKLENKKDANSVEYTVRIQDPWRQTTMDICLNFVPILYSTFNLLTAMDKKFVQVKVICMSNETSYKLTGVNMELVNQENLPGLELRSMNQNYPELVISKQFEGAFLWQLKMADNNQLTSHQDGTADQNNKSPLNKVGGDEPAKVALKFSYAPIASEEGDKTSSAALGSAGKRNEDDIVTSLQSMDLAGDLDELMETEKEFCASYTFQDYRTLYTVYAKVEPAKGNEFCRASTLCPMKIEVEQLFDPQTAGIADNKQQGQQRRGDTAASSGGGQTSLFYEIIADQTQWAVCGKQGAVINIQRSARESITVDVMPLTGGQLPLPTVRLSKYIPADHGGNNAARLDPFAIGQVYNMSRAQQIHVLPPVTAASTAAAAAASHQQMLVAAGGAATQQQEFLSLP